MFDGVSTETLLRTAIAVVALLLLAVIATSLLRLPRALAPAIAVVRGALQLALLSLVLTGIVTNGWWVAAFLVVMFTVAVIVAARRSRLEGRGWPPVALAMAAGVIPVCALVFALGAIEFSSRYVLAFCAIIIGGSMTISAVAGRALRTALDDHWEEVEGWLALGATPRQSTIRLGRLAAETALVPLTDQAKTTGIVVLPGAFIGAVFGGLSPIAAGLFQITVLAGLIASGSVTMLLLVLGSTRRVIRPVPAETRATD